MGRLLRVTGSDLEKLTSSVLTVLTDQPKQKYPPVCQRHLPAPSAGRIRSECTALANGLGACCRPVITVIILIISIILIILTILIILIIFMILMRFRN